jgi:hypothetical protein
MDEWWIVKGVEGKVGGPTEALSSYLSRETEKCCKDPQWEQPVSLPTFEMSISRRRLKKFLLRQSVRFMVAKQFILLWRKTQIINFEKELHLLLLVQGYRPLACLRLQENMSSRLAMGRRILPCPLGLLVCFSNTFGSLSVVILKIYSFQSYFCLSVHCVKLKRNCP